MHHAVFTHARVPAAASLRRRVIDWLTEGRITRLETRMSAQTDAFAELDAQIDALEAYVTNDDTTDAAEVTARANRIRTLLAAVNPEHPDPAPGEAGAVEPDPTAPIDVEATPDQPAAPADPDPADAAPTES